MLLHILIVLKFATRLCLKTLVMSIKVMDLVHRLFTLMFYRLHLHYELTEISLSDIMLFCVFSFC